MMNLVLQSFTVSASKRSAGGGSIHEMKNSNIRYSKFFLSKVLYILSLPCVARINKFKKCLYRRECVGVWFECFECECLITV